MAKEKIYKPYNWFHISPFPYLLRCDSWFKGPAYKLMRTLGLEVSSVGVAKCYQDFLGHFVIDNKDKELKSKIESLGIKTYCFDTLMTDLKKKKELAQFLVNLS